jgi:hypothetical protein
MNLCFAGGKRRKGVKFKRMDRAGRSGAQDAFEFGPSCYPFFCYFSLGKQRRQKRELLSEYCG